MTTPSTNKSTNKNTPRANGLPDPSAEAVPQTGTVATSPTPSASPDKKPVTVMVTESLHRKAKITAELSGISLSDLIEAQLRVIVKDRLPGLLLQLGDEP